MKEKMAMPSLPVPELIEWDHRSDEQKADGIHDEDKITKCRGINTIVVDGVDKKVPCGKMMAKGEFKVCGTCYAAPVCSKECQESYWPRHKIHCIESEYM